MQIKQNEIEQTIRQGVDRLLDKDMYLLVNNVNERTISGRLAFYLQELFYDCDVDCEYNRFKTEPKRLDIVHDELCKELRKSHKSISPLDDKGTTVYPDIIIHQWGSDDNLAVIEIKKNSSTDKEDNFDLIKLKKYKSQLGYKNAIFLKFLIDSNDITQYEFRFIQ
ncbi:MAG: hypothetical protein PHF74_03940 [Dehalococcoidales bacterium]|nr:hypothetical protein [Dehalococcoidales bacterium]